MLITYSGLFAAGALPRTALPFPARGYRRAPRCLPYASTCTATSRSRKTWRSGLRQAHGLPTAGEVQAARRRGCGSSPEEAVYRFVGHTPGVHVVLSGSTNSEHMRANAAALERGPLPPAVEEQLIDWFPNCGWSLNRERERVVSGEWGVVSGEWGVGSGEWGVVSGEWGVGSGEWGVGSGEWGVGSGKWGVVSGEW